jgi:cholesterol oxidase
MASFDYDVVIIGSGFGGSVAALRAAEKGYRVGVMESGRRWKDEDIPKTQWNLPDFLWFPAAELYGIQRMEITSIVPWSRAAFEFARSQEEA